MTPSAQLPHWVCDPSLHPAWDRIRTRFEKAGLEARGIVVVPMSSREERHALGALLGRVVVRDSARIDLAVLDTRLRQRCDPGGLQAVLTEIFGAPPRDRPAVRAAQDEARERPLALAAELVQAPWAGEWVAGMRRTGLLARGANASVAERAVRDAAVVLVELTAGGPSDELDGDRLGQGDRGRPADVPRMQSRVELAARLLGDAHALDRDRLLHRVVLRGLAAASGEELPEGAREFARLWVRFGVVPDLLSRTCLVWNLRTRGTEALSLRLNAAAGVGDPLHITERDLRRTQALTPVPGSRILVCENPAVVEALADRGIPGWGAVCTAGEPNLVVDRVLASLADCGVVLRYHGDFDWAGLAIANRAIERYGVRPLRMNVDDYLAAVRGDGPKLRGAETEPLWDPELGPAMRRHARAVHEESVLADLFDALAHGSV